MNINIHEDIILIRELNNITREDLAKKLDVEPITLLRAENKEHSLSKKLIEKIYNYAFENKIYLNKIKEMLNKEELINNNVLLFHGSKQEISSKIDLKYGRKNNDFGQGFYCGESYSQSASFVYNYPDSSIYMFSFKPDNLSFYKFNVDQEWMLIIAYYRGKLDKYKYSPLLISILDKIKDKDYLIAPITDNKMFSIIDSFIEGEITDEQCKHCLAATNLGNQYVMLSNKCLNNLVMLEKLYLSQLERKYFENLKNEENKISDDKVKIAKIEYRGKGQYIDELLK